jgi:hypothetical protein
MWLNISLARLPQGQAFERALALRDRITKMLTPEHLVEARRMARGWLNKQKPSTAHGVDAVLLATLAKDETPTE